MACPLLAFCLRSAWQSVESVAAMLPTLCLGADKLIGAKAPAMKGMPSERGREGERGEAKAVASFLMFATASGVLFAIFLNTAGPSLLCITHRTHLTQGGAWDNAKKCSVSPNVTFPVRACACRYIEQGVHGGKGSAAHKVKGAEGAEGAARSKPLRPVLSFAFRQR